MEESMMLEYLLIVWLWPAVFATMATVCGVILVINLIRRPQPPHNPDGRETLR